MELICKHCGKVCSTRRSLGQHQSFCRSNPTPRQCQFVIFNRTRGPWNKGLNKAIDRRVARSSETLRAGYADGRLKTFGACSSTYLGTDAHRRSSSRGGGYKERAGRSKKTYVEDSFGKITCLQSSYEARLADLLNSMCIKWKRPGALTYGDKKRYFSDFYLTDYDLYLDTKNEYLARLDAEKIRQVCATGKRVHIIRECQICEEYIRTLL